MRNQCESAEEIDFQLAYNQIFKEYSKMKKLNLNKLNEVDLEKEYLAKLPDLNALLDSLKSKNYMLMSKVKSLEDELVCAKPQFATSSSDKWACILRSQKPFCDECNVQDII